MTKNIIFCDDFSIEGVKPFVNLKKCEKKKKKCRLALTYVLTPYL
jgi:hypothetical protein